MKKNLNIIQINGIKGLFIIGFGICCLAVGFIAFPGWLAMKVWNYIASYAEIMPFIGIVQGVLLWGILVASYFTFRKEKLIVCMKASEGLSEEELKSVFSEIKKQANDDIFIKNMIKAHQAELKIKNLSESNIPQQESVENKEKIESK